MNPISFLSLASKTAKAYESFCRPVCKKHRINQTCLDVILFLANNPEYNTARDLCELRGIRSGNASVAIDTLAGRGLLTRTTDGSHGWCLCRKPNRLSQTAARFSSSLAIGSFRAYRHTNCRSVQTRFRSLAPIFRICFPDYKRTFYYKMERNIS